MSKIVIDGRMINESGIGRYIRNLISNLQLIDKENDYFILHLKKDFDSLKYSENFHKVLADFSWYGIKEQIEILGLLKLLKPDLTHFPHFNTPIFYQGKFVVTIHDLIHQHFSMQRTTTRGPIIYKVKKLGYRIVFKNALSKSSKILVPSRFVKSQLITDWQIQPEKIVVTLEGADKEIIEKCRMSDIECKTLLRKLNIKMPYIFYVGNVHPHKNVEGLIREFREIRAKYPELQLVLAGADHYFWQRLKKENQIEGVIYTGFVTDGQLVALYKNAEAFVMPSLEEGFGIPLLEAMACGCPIVSSNAGSLKEVGGEAALYFNPVVRGDLGSKVSMVLGSSKIREELVSKGRDRVKLFSWKKLARQTHQVYEEIL